LEFRLSGAKHNAREIRRLKAELQNFFNWRDDAMTKDDRDILELLKSELSFIEEGGYGRSVRTPWLPKSIFQDSLSCLNYGYSYRGDGTAKA
jgi:hypothetical protein